MSSNYQKVYMNQIHSSSLLCQLAQLWKNQQLCDAIIRTGSVVTKAHRVVLVAACPMLQSMENASFGSHLEVRLAAEIKQDSVNTFLQYLYEGFMMLTEENVRDVEKIAKLLQVENIITCCSDFDKCLRTKQGMPPHSSQYKYNYHDQVEFRHVRTTDLQKTFHERMMKRASEMSRPASPGHKRPRMHKSANSDLSNYGANRMDDSSAMSQGYHGHTMSGPGSGGSGGDTWERIPKLNPGFQSSRSSSFSRSSSADPGVVEIREDSVEIIQTEQPEPGHGQSEPKSKSVAISVAGQMNNEYDLQIVNVSAGDTESKTGTKASSTSSRAPITVSPLSVHSDSSSSPIIKDNSSHHPPPPKLERSGQLTQSRDENRRRSDYHLQTSQNRSDSDMYSHSPSRQRIEEQKRQSYSQRSESDIYSEDKGSHRQPYPVTMSSAGMSKQFTSGSVQSKPFAAGSIMQANSPMPSPGSSHKSATSSNQERQESSEMPLGQMSSGVDKLEQQASSSADLTPDLSIVKIESANNSNMDDTGGLDMYVDMPDQSMISHMQGDEEVPDDHSDYEQPSGDWGQEDMSNEGSNISGDQSMYMGNMKDRTHSPGTSRSMYIKNTYTPGFIQGWSGSQPSKSYSNITTSSSGFASIIEDQSAVFEQADMNEDVNIMVNKLISESNSSIYNEHESFESFINSHRLISHDGKKQKNCAFCLYNKTRTRSGYCVLTRHKCEQCNVSLCKGEGTERACFYLFHQSIYNRDKMK